jgi:hypothetical protein
MGQIQGRVFDSSLYAFIADVAISLSGAGYALTTYVDGSLLERDVSIAWLNANTWKTSDFLVREASLSSQFSWVGGGLFVDTSSGEVTFAYVDGSLATRDSSIDWLISQDASTIKIIRDASTSPYLTSEVRSIIKEVSGGIAELATFRITNLGSGGSTITVDRQAEGNFLYFGIDAPSKTNVDASFGLYATNASVNAVGFATNSSVNSALGAYATNASVNAAGFATNSSVNSALGAYATNSSVNLALGAYATNASIGLAAFVKSVSIGTSDQHSVYWSAGYLEASMGSGTADVTKAYVDGSLGERDVSIAWLSTNKLNITDASTTYAKRLTSFSLANSAFLASASDNNNIIFADVSALTITFPNTLEVGFQSTVVNRTTGITTINASTLYTTDSSVVLRDRYAAASIVCTSTGVFYAFGNLK